MSWLKCLILSLGLLICASPAAAKIEHFTDSEGTVHITNSGPEESTPAAHEKMLPRSHRVMNPYAGSTWPPPPIRPSPYLRPNGQPVSDNEAPSPVGVQKPQPAPERPESSPVRPKRRR